MKFQISISLSTSLVNVEKSAGNIEFFCKQFTMQFITMSTENLKHPEKIDRFSRSKFLTTFFLAKTS